MGSWLSTAYYMDVLRQKIRTRASFTKILVNYISTEESLINAVYNKNTIKGFEGSSIESIRYQMPYYKQNGYTVLFT